MIWKSPLRFVNLITIVVLVWLHWRGSENQGQAKILSDGRVEFPPSSFAAAAWLAIVAPSVLAAIGAWRHGLHEPRDFWTTAGVWLIAFLEIVSFPGTIVVTRDGLEQVYWLQWNRCIRWSDIVEIKTGKGGGTVSITSTEGTKIVHTGQLADRPRLLLELKRHCGSELPRDFPREPLGDA